jgi:2-keto-4-pentenoate hydratase/2-oxohepta-3-ene-1,7-dioic acid hydratase in catechol pathway
LLQSKAGKISPNLADSRAYLANLPESERDARELLAWGEKHLGDLGDGERFPLNALRLLEPVEVVALFDFGLTPRHLKNSAETLMKYEKDNPQTAPLLQAFAKAVMAPKPKSVPGRPEPLSYYKCNMNAIVGDGETVPWPAYTSRLDVEPELAVVYGNEKQPVAGFCIFNDVSARDVQATEFVGGFCLTKDMAKGNQLGPYLVTPDEVGDPYKLRVTVLVNGEVKYEGSTSEISHKAEDVFAWLGFMAPPKPGSVMGLGTIPDCTGLDHDDFIDPGAEIQITFERLGTLNCRFAQPAGKLLASRWPVREPLKKYHE